MSQDQARWISWISLLGFSVLWLARWPTFPLSLDPYYHLFVAQQVADAGGPLGYEWWEYAPVGRPHLYPPLLHLVLAGGLKIGCPSVLLLRLASVLIVPLVLAMISLLLRRLFDESTALAGLWVALVPFSFPLHAAITMASSLALIELGWLILAIEQRRVVAAGCLLGLLFYTHLGLPWVGLVSLVCYAAFRPGIRPTLLKVSWGLGLAIPWLIHVASHARWLRPTWRYENETLEISVAVYLLALVGAIRCFKQAGPARLCPSLWLGFCLLASHFPYRWLSGEGLLPVILLGGVGTEWLARWWEQRSWRPVLGMRLVILGLAALSPTLLLNLPAPMSPGQAGRFQIRSVWLDATPFHLLQCSGVTPKVLETSLYTPNTKQLVTELIAVSHPREIFWSNAPYTVGLVAALAHRPISSAMMYEVSAASPFNPIDAAHLVVWFKIKPLVDTPSLDDLIRRHELKPVAEDDIALVFRNPRASELAHEPQAAIPFWLAFMLLCGLLGLIVWDFRKTPAEKPRGHESVKSTFNLRHQR